MTTPQEDPTADLIGEVSRAAAARLTSEHGPALTADVEAALADRGDGQRSGQYIDPVSLGSLIVAVATLAWSIYSNRRKQSPDPPSAAVLAREVRIELRRQASTSPHDTDEVTQIVVTELLRAAHTQAGRSDQDT